MAVTPPQTSPHSLRRPVGHWAALYRSLTILASAALWPFVPAEAARSCDDWSAEVVSVEGKVEIRRSAGPPWAPLATGERVCTGDLVQSHGASRATLILPDGNTFRLDENTAVNIPEPPSGLGSLLELLRGVIHVISRDPRALTFMTPYANAGLEGTEFDLRVDTGERFTEVVVLEGAVNVSTPTGALKVGSEQVVLARDGQEPTAAPIARPIDRMRWASHYPPLLDGAPPDSERAPSAAELRDPEFYARRAAARLTTARVQAAEADIARALQLAPGNATALSLRALLALARAERDTARTLVEQALAADAASVVARLARSYVEQSSSELVAAERAVREALSLEPDNVLALTRLAELLLAQDDAAAAVAAATHARALAPTRSEPLVVLGFARLRAFDTAAAHSAFADAVVLESDSPLARLGLALALFRRGDEQAGRRQLEIAVALDPANPLTRSYVAKAYEAEHRAALTERQLVLAQDLDPFDPTPWLYSALHKLRDNRPVEALHDYRAAARTNGDEPVFRSRLPLDEDLATRSTGLARVQTGVGFDQLALVDAWRSIPANPADFAGHRLLADAYSTKPRHEIARVSELLTAQLLQPANVTPLKPQLGQTNLAIAQRAGASSASFDELDPPVLTNGLKARVSGATGANDIDSHDVSLAGLHDRWSYSVGHYGFATDGLRENNDYDQQAGNAFVQYRPSHDTSLQAELRSTRTEHGDLSAFFNRTLYSSLLRFEEDADSLRLGSKHRLTAGHTLLTSLIYQDVAARVAADLSSLQADQRAYNADVQHLYDSGVLRFQSGVSAAQQNLDVRSVLTIPELGIFTSDEDRDNRQLTLYSYAHFEPTPSLTLTAGLSLDRIDNELKESEAANPKLGMIWRPTRYTTVRAAAFETLFGSLTTSTQNAQPRLEPVQVAGFTQLLFGGTADRASVRGLAVEHEVAPSLFVGWEASTRKTERTGQSPLSPTDTMRFNLAERAQEAYLYWLPTADVSVAVRYERSRYGSEPVPLFGYANMKTTRLPFEIRYFTRSGFTFGARASYIDQEGLFQTALQQLGEPSPPMAHGEDRFWVLDGFVGYRLANRRGLVTLNADNLLDKSFQFQDVDPTNPSLFPDRLISLRFTLAF